ncbi:hypothetical protein CTN02_05660 [Lysinibacillus sphaericus]|nr:hypothetical protein CTN02_05660 [Lysinibacillus sphaericus]
MQFKKRYNVEKKEPHPSIPGVNDVNYKIAKQERSVFTNEFKAATHKKTAYDDMCLQMNKCINMVKRQWITVLNI